MKGLLEYFNSEEKNVYNLKDSHIHSIFSFMNN